MAAQHNWKFGSRAKRDPKTIYVSTPMDRSYDDNTLGYAV